MFHDLCKIDQYRCERQENTIRWEYNPDTLFKGHGEKSVMLLSQFFQLTEEELPVFGITWELSPRRRSGTITPGCEDVAQCPLDAPCRYAGKPCGRSLTMKIIEPKVELINSPAYFDLLSLTELAGRTCYKSEAKISEGSAEKFVRIF